MLCLSEAIAPANGERCSSGRRGGWARAVRGGTRSPSRALRSSLWGWDLCPVRNSKRTGKMHTWLEGSEV